MAKPLNVSLPPNIYLWDSCVIRVTALDPTTGATVSGVTVSNVAFQVESLGSGSLAYGPFLLVPGPGS